METWRRFFGNRVDFPDEMQKEKLAGGRKWFLERRIFFRQQKTPTAENRSRRRSYNRMDCVDWLIAAGHPKMPPLSRR
jgi:hypothetical protein